MLDYLIDIPILCLAIAAVMSVILVVVFLAYLLVQFILRRISKK